MQTSSIPYHIRSILVQLEPSLDIHWEAQLKDILAGVDREDWEE